MLTLHPPLIGNYFRSRASSIATVPRSFFLSWEDALWHLLTVYKVKQGAVALVPEFYCGDVSKNMRNHGLKVIEYPCDDKLVTDPKLLRELIVETQPTILIIFHMVGISSKLLSQQKLWRPSLPHDCLIIEDCVHKLIGDNPPELTGDRHFAIDSLRKVAPIQGSYLYSSHPMPRVTLAQSLQTLPYRISVFVWWIVMQFFLSVAYYSPSSRLSKTSNLLAESAMLAGYNLIGKEKLASPGIAPFRALVDHIDYEGIRAVKVRQAKNYRRSLQHLLKSSDFWFPTMEDSDLPELRGFPLIMSCSVADQFLSYLRAEGILIRFELNDSSWSTKQKIVYLPMGIHLTDFELTSIVATLYNAML